MTTQKHTPGPWKPVPNEHSTARTLVLAGDALVAWGNCEANARLIAAAPELLAALEALQPILWNDGPLVAAYLDVEPMVESALRKARGENAEVAV